MGGIDLFPNATIWIQRDEFTYYVRDAWLDGGSKGADRSANLAALERMIRLAGSPARVIPGHDPLQFTRFGAQGRVAHIDRGNR